MQVFLAIVLSLLLSAGALFVLSYADYLAAQNRRASSNPANAYTRPLILEQAFQLPWLMPHWIIAGACIFLLFWVIGLMSIWLMLILAFLGTVILAIFLWQDMQQVAQLNHSIPEKIQIPSSSSLSLERARLYGIHGEYKGQVLECGPDTLIGRSTQCQIRLQKSDVSGRHARIVFRQGRWYIQDMSRWGTLVDGIAIRAQPLRDGSKIRISNTEFEFRVE